MAPRRSLGRGSRAARSAAGAALCLAATASAYDYERIVEEYCHTALDWGAIPPRPAGASELLQVQVFIRHGSRTQCYAQPACWPKDEETGAFHCDLNYLENSVGSGGTLPLTESFQMEYLQGRNGIAGNCMTGQLVPDGLRMQVNNGERLREAYVARERLLPESLDGMDEAAIERAFFLRSTDVPRTKQSGMALFSGLYKDHRREMPPYVKLHTMDISEENMLVNPANCPAVQLAQDDFLRTYPNIDAVESLCKEFGSESSGSPASRLECMKDLVHQIDCLMSRMCPTVPFHPRNATIPAKYLTEDAALLRRLWRTLDELQFEYFRKLRRFGIGPFVSEILAAASAAVNGSREARRFVLWSGHDTGPMEPLWAAFQLREGPPYWPPFASMLVLEVWNSSHGPMVRWVSNGAVAGGGAQPWAAFHEQAKGLVPTAAECKVDAKDDPLKPMWEAQRLLSKPLAVIVPALAGAFLTLLSVAAYQRSWRGPCVGGKMRSCLMSPNSGSSGSMSPDSPLLSRDGLGA